MRMQGVIARDTEGSRFQYIYVESDSRLECLGKLLQNHWNTREKVDELFSKDMSIITLGKNIDLTEFYADIPIQTEHICSLFNRYMPYHYANYFYIFTLRNEWEYKTCTPDRYKWSDFKLLKQALNPMEKNNGC